MMILDLKVKPVQKKKQLIELLAAGQVIAYPTETVYGLGCDATNKLAIEQIYQIKEKDSNNPLLLLVGSRAMAGKYFEFNKLARRLAKKYWPGALSLILPVKAEYREALGAEKLGVRLSSDLFATGLSRRLGKPITSTSANPSGQPAALSGDQVVAYFADKLNGVAALADVGTLNFAVGSTIIDTTVMPAKIIRQGAVLISEKELAK